MKSILKKLTDKNRQKKFFYDRFTEPLHLNLLSLFVRFFGTVEQKIDFDLIARKEYAFCIYKAAKLAKMLDLKSVTVIEFGVAGGAGLLNMCYLAEKITKATGIEIKIFGFDTGEGMPPAIDYRDLPEFFTVGDFPPVNQEKLIKSLPPNAKLILGNIKETASEFLSTITKDSPIGFVAVDVDYYSSAKDCFKIFLDDPEKYLPMTLIWLDDIGILTSNPWVGEELAVNEFNAENTYRKIHPYTFLRDSRIFKKASWLRCVYAMQTLDHPWRNLDHKSAKSRQVLVLGNPYW